MLTHAHSLLPETDTTESPLKAVEQKISNIVNVIANTGSAALANQLMLLENEKEVLDFQIREEERNAEDSISLSATNVPQW